VRCVLRELDTDNGVERTRSRKALAAEHG